MDAVLIPDHRYDNTRPRHVTERMAKLRAEGWHVYAVCVGWEQRVTVTAWKEVPVWLPKKRE